MCIISNWLFFCLAFQQLIVLRHKSATLRAIPCRFFHFSIVYFSHSGFNFGHRLQNRAVKRCNKATRNCSFSGMLIVYVSALGKNRQPNSTTAEGWKMIRSVKLYNTRICSVYARRGITVGVGVLSQVPSLLLFLGGRWIVFLLPLLPKQKVEWWFQWRHGGVVICRRRRGFGGAFCSTRCSQCRAWRHAHSHLYMTPKLSDANADFDVTVLWRQTTTTVGESTGVVSTVKMLRKQLTPCRHMRNLKGHRGLAGSPTFWRNQVKTFAF